MGRRTSLAAVAMGVGFALVAAACGGDDNDGGTTGAASTTTTAAGSGGSSTTAATTATTAAKEPHSIEEWEALWADQRAAMVKRIKDNGWGKSADGKTVTGPEGFTMDLSKCPAGWSETEGLTDTSIKIGNPTALSGIGADFGNLSKTADAWFKYQGSKGLFKDSTGKTRTIEYLVRDDGYDVVRTIPLVDELLDSEKVFAIQTLGTPAGLKVYGKINQRCVPHPLTVSGSPAWGDPVNHPWSAGGSLLSYGTEATVWGAFIDQHIDELTKDTGKVRIAALVANSDFGLAYEGAFKSVVEASPNKDKIELIIERLEITAPTVTDPMTTLASKEPNVFITMTGGVQCPQIINEVAGNGMGEKLKYKFMSSVCKSSAYVGKDKVGGDGMQSDGWHIVGGGQKDINSPENDNDGFSVWARKFLADNGLDTKISSNLGFGFYPAWVWTQALAVAGQLDGGLTRSNLILALRTFKGSSPVHLEGIEINMDGNKDAYLMEGSDLSKYDAAKQQWVVQGNIIELSGKTKNCTWSTEINACS
jgi:hypothetical protein